MWTIILQANEDVPADGVPDAERLYPSVHISSTMRMEVEEVGASVTAGTLMASPDFVQAVSNAIAGAVTVWGVVPELFPMDPQQISCGGLTLGTTVGSISSTTGVVVATTNVTQVLSLVYTIALHNTTRMVVEKVRTASSTNTTESRTLADGVVLRLNAEILANKTVADLIGSVKSAVVTKTAVLNGGRTVLNGGRRLRRGSLEEAHLSGEDGGREEAHLSGEDGPEKPPEHPPELSLQYERGDDTGRGKIRSRNPFASYDITADVLQE